MGQFWYFGDGTKVSLIQNNAGHAIHQTPQLYIIKFFVYLADLIYRKLNVSLGP